jgi:tetratricopeptide (TPR) repeat protein
VQKVQLVFALRSPEQFDWQHDPGFSAPVHTHLVAERERIVQSTPSADRRPEAEAGLLPLRACQMSQRQEMLLYYLLAQCARAQDLSLSTYFSQALAWCSRAEQIAGTLLDFGAQVDLHELRGTLHRAISLYWIAAEEFSYALRLLREHAEDTESFDPEFEVTLAAKTATLDYLLGNFPRALEHVRRAAALLPLTTRSLAGQGTVAWTFALLHRQRNEPVEALRHVQVAAALYQQLGATNSTCRVLSLAADIALDIAESSAREAPAAPAAPAAHERSLTLAAHYVEEALGVGRAADDLAGIELAKLSLARLQRVQDATGVQDAEASIRSVLRQARKMRDDSLLTAAQTALGVDLLVREEQAAGKRWLRKAIATAARINAPGLAFRAQRSLRQADGRNV